MEKFTSKIIEEFRNNSYEADYAYTYQKINDYLTSERENVFPSNDDLKLLNDIDLNFNEKPEATNKILEELANLGEKTTTLSSSSRYFGFVVGSSFPIALQARLLADAWDQNSALYLMSPIASKIEEIVEKWLIELLGLPNNSAMGLVSGSATATILALNAACFRISKNDRSKVKVVVSEEAHATVLKSLKILGINQSQLIMVPANEKGEIDVSKLPEFTKDMIVILQAGNVNGGAYDDFTTICTKANKAKAWVHIDGAFGLYVNANEKLKHLTSGIELASSWTFDAHKTLNTPYDNGVVVCKNREIYLESLQVNGSYLVASTNRDGMAYTNEMSRRARAIELWATLKALGKEGVSDLVYELYCKTAYFAKGLEKLGFNILNEVVFNQIVMYYENDNQTKSILNKINESGICFMSSSNWHNHFVIRVSVSSYKTTYDDIDYCLKEIAKIIDS